MLATNLFLIQFNHKVDRKNALEGCSWAIDRHALLFTEIDSLVALTDHVIKEMRIVIKVHNFPIENQNSEAAEAIGANFGRYLGTLKSGGAGLGRTFRVKVAVDVTQPLKRGFFALNEQGFKCWYSVTYERLPMFCFLCGVLGHGETQCPTRYEEGFEEPEEALPFGNWLRAMGDNFQDQGVPLPLQAIDSRGSKSLGQRGEQKRGGASFGMGKENIQVADNQGAGDSISGSNYSVGDRRRIDPSKLKRKQTVTKSHILDGGFPSKKLHLALRDEDDDSTAEVAQQPRRIQ